MRRLVPLLLVAACNDPSVGFGEWKPTTPMPLRRAFAAVGEVQGHVVVAGGLTDICPGGAPLCDTDEVDVYDPKTLTWEVGAPLPPGAPRHHASASVYQNRLYVLNGFVGATAPRAATTAWRYDLIGWTRRSDPPVLRGAAPAATLGSKIWIAGGADASGAIADLWSYDAANDVWAPRAPLPAPRSGSAACTIGQHLVVVGGRNAAGAVVATSEDYDVDKDSWAPLPPLPTARADLSGLSFAGECHAFGGVDGSGVPTSEHEALRLDSDWHAYAPLLSARAAAASTTLGAGQIYVIGGTTLGGTFLPSVELWTPSL